MIEDNSLLNKKENLDDLKIDGTDIRDEIYRCSNCYKILLSSINIDKEILILNSCTCCNIVDLNNLTNFIPEKKLSLNTSFCSKCGKSKRNNKGNKEEDYFYCYTCKFIFCHFCKRFFHKEHKNIIKLKQFDSTCEEHNFTFTNYCLNCNKSICPECEIVHDKNHKINVLNTLLVDSKIKDKYKEIIDKEIYVSKQIENLKKKIIDNFNLLILNIETSYKKYKSNITNLINIQKTLLNFNAFAVKNFDICYEQIKTCHNFFNESSNQLNDLLNKIDNFKNINIINQYINFIELLNDKNIYVIKTSDDFNERLKEFSNIIIPKINDDNNKNKITKTPIENISSLINLNKETSGLDSNKIIDEKIFNQIPNNIKKINVKNINLNNK